MLDAGVVSYDSLRSHVHWVYCAYILLTRQDKFQKLGLHRRQKLLTQQLEACEFQKIVQLSTRIDGATQVKNHCHEVIDALRTA